MKTGHAFKNLHIRTWVALKLEKLSCAVRDGGTPVDIPGLKLQVRYAARSMLVLLVCVIGGVVLGNQQIGQSVLPGANIPKFVEPLPTFNGKRANGAQPEQLLTVTAQEFQQKILPSSFYATLPYSVTYTDQVSGQIVARINPRKGTYAWGYQIDDGEGEFGPSYPARTIVVQQGVLTSVRFVNNLVPFRDLDGRTLAGPLLQKFLTVDQSFHWANPLNTPHSISGSDPDTGFDLGNPAFFSGPQPMTVHLHGAETSSAFDGGPDTWFTPGETITGPGFVSDTYRYVNTGDPTTLWFHDHVLGETRLNVYAGLVGFYFLRGKIESDVSPPLPNNDQEVELVIQDRQFDTYGQPFFPDGNPAGAGLNGDPGNPSLHAYAIPEFFGDVIVVNGKSWPYLNVEPRRYRFRFLDACNARMLGLRLADDAGNTTGPTVPTIWQIGSDGGLLDNPVAIKSFTPFTLDPANTSSSPFGTPVFSSPRLFFAPAERMDVIIDFSGLAGKTFTVINDANYPFPGGSVPDPALDGLIMQFRVTKPLSSIDTSFNPAVAGGRLRSGSEQIPRLTDGKGGLGKGVKVNNARRLVLIEEEDPDTGAPVKVLINNTHWNGSTPMGMYDWQDGQPIPESLPFNNGTINVTEFPQIGSTEIWEFVNLTPDAHPIHIHLIQFQVISRQVLNVGAVVPDTTPPYHVPPPPFFTTPGYRTEAYEAAWLNSGLPFAQQFGTEYGGGPPLDYLTPNLPMGGNPDVTDYLIGKTLPPDPNEAGWKDTLKMHPGTVTRLLTRWAPQSVPVGAVTPGQNTFTFDPTATLGVQNDGFGFPGGPGYMAHCHILDHEDNEMMRPFIVSKSAGH
jgi:FtsP/CotA-like multicopper oxidase with cupredoxin domain